MKIREIKENKKQFLSLLLLADEQENMIDRYLERGTMYVLNDNGVKAECVVTSLRSWRSTRQRLESYDTDKQSVP